MTERPLNVGTVACCFVVHQLLTAKHPSTHERVHDTFTVKRLALSGLFGGLRRGMKAAANEGAIKAAPVKRFFNPARSGMDVSKETCWFSA